MSARSNNIPFPDASSQPPLYRIQGELSSIGDYTMPFFDHNGHKLFYRETGSGPLLMILPGNTASSACHTGEIDHFGREYRAVALDFWGTGQSDRMEVWPDDWWEQGARDAAALIQYLGDPQAIVIGTSGGALVALLTAILYPRLVRGVIADSTVEHFPAPVLSREIQGRSQHTDEQVRFWRWAQGADWEQVVKADPDFLLRFERGGGDCFRGRLKEIQCPVLLTASLGDSSLPESEAQVRRMAAQIRSSRLFLAPEGSHPLMWSRAEDFRREADLFLASLTTSKANGLPS